MDQDKTNKNLQNKNLKIFFVKLISISIAIVIVINLLFNLILAERLEKLDKILLLNDSNARNQIKEKIRDELEDSLSKENLIYEKDKILLYKLYQKLNKEFDDLDKNKL